MFRTNRVLSWTVGLLAVLATAPAQARLYCSSNDYCYFNMPLYSQNDESIGTYWLPNGGANSMLCGPTSAAMALGAVINHKPSWVTTHGWTASSFHNVSWQNRVRNEASLVGCTPTGGTMFYPWIDWAGESRGVSGRYGDFKYYNQYQAGFGTTSGWQITSSNATFKNLVRSGYASALVHGHYYKNVTTVLGTKFVTYSRSGGHVVAVGGHWGNSWIYIYNPWYAQTQWRSIGQLYSGTTWRVAYYIFGVPVYVPDTVTVLPNGQGSQGYLHSSGTYYAVVEGYTGLTTY